MVRASLALAALLASAPSCPDLYSLAAHGFRVPTLTARSASAVPAGSGVQVTVDVAAHNPNPFPIELTGVDYDVALDGTPALSGSQQGTTVAQQTDGGLQLGGVLNPGSAVFKNLRPGQTVHYALNGTAHVASPAGVPVDVEFTTGGTFVVPQTLPAGR
jgi:LEA14-like dessication related protein